MILEREFYERDCLDVAPDLVGKRIVHILPDGTELSAVISETEAYRGTEDTACHASKGRTPRTELLFGEAGIIYVYLCYGMHWLMNVITGEKDQPQGVLLRAARDLNGPAKLTKHIMVGKEMNGKPICGDPSIYIEDIGEKPEIIRLPRVGINYATPEYRDILWRYADRKYTKK